MYNQQYFNQPSIDRINNQIAELERIKTQMQQPQPSINQTFQLTNSPSGIKYANNIEEVQKEIVIGETPYFSKDMSVVWIKNIKGEIKSYELNEIVAKDEKDIRIEYLQSQIEELKKEVKRNEPIDEFIDEPIKDEKSSSISTTRATKKK